MIIVAGQILVEPDQRDAYLQSCVDVIEQARIEPGCLSHAALSAGRLRPPPSSAPPLAAAPRSCPASPPLVAPRHGGG